MSDIKPCPACGDAKPAFVREQGRYPARGQMACHGCGARGPLAWTLDEAREGWDGMPREEAAPVSYFETTPDQECQKGEADGRD